MKSFIRMTKVSTIKKYNLLILLGGYNYKDDNYIDDNQLCNDPIDDNIAKLLVMKNILVKLELTALCR